VVEEGQLVEILIELKSEVAGLRADMRTHMEEQRSARKELDKLKSKVNVAQGAVLVIGAIVGFVAKLFLSSK